MDFLKQNSQNLHQGRAITQNKWFHARLPESRQRPPGFPAKKKKILPGIIEGSQAFGLGVKFVFFEWMA
jgi:hypothetical protein